MKNLSSYTYGNKEFKLPKNSCFVNSQSALHFRSKENYDELDRELKSLMDEYNQNHDYTYSVVKKALYNEFAIGDWN